MKTRNVKISKENLQKIYHMVFQMNQMKLKLRDGQSLVHLAVNGISPVDDFHTSDVCKFPCLDTVRLLLHCGASVDCFDQDRNSPLHTLASTFPLFRPVTEELIHRAEEITKLFVDAGIHLDSVNTENQTAAKTCSSRKLLHKFIFPEI